MSILDERAAKAIQEAMDARVRALSVKSATSHMAEVIEIDAEGVTWVHIFGGADRTPAIRTLAKVKKGDLVTVTIEEGVVTITGSPSSPSASIEYVDAANYEIASYAKEAIAGILGDVIQVKNAIIERATIEDLTAVEATIETLTADYANLNELVAGKANISDLTAATGRISQLEADNVTVNGKITAAEGRIGTIESDYLKTQDMDAEVARVGTLLTGYAEADLANVNNAWIENGVIKDAAITNEMVGSLSANKLTAGTINGSVINVTNLNADNITAGTINGQRIGEGSLSLDKLSEDVYTESEVDTIVEGLNDRIDGAIETHTGTVVPTLNNSPASAWNTTDLKDEHVGDVYYVVNSQSQQNGYCYRFTKTGNTYSWQLIKDSDVTAALSRISTAEGKITTFDSDISTLKTDTGELKTKTQTLETSLGDKVDTSTFNELSSTVDENSATITSMSTVLTNNGLTSSTNITQTVNNVSQTATSNSSTISQLVTTLGTNADGTTKAGDIVHRTSAVEQDLSGFKTTVSNTYASKTSVEAAQADATSALNTAEEANTTANTAKSTADTAKTTAESASSTASTAKTTADTAKTTADTAKTTADTAKTTADTAKTTADTAKTTAETASTNATNALNRQVAYSATCSTAAGTAAKVATCTQFPALAAGVTVTVRFSVANTSTGAVTLNVNSTGAKTIYVNGAATAAGNQMLWAANANVTFTYDGTYWRVVSEPRTWYGTCATAAGTAAKAATINEIVVCKGTVVKLNMTYENTSTSATMNLTSTGAKNLYYGTTTTRPTTGNGYGWGAASTATFVFDGQYWRVGDTSVLSRLIQAETTISSHTTSINQNAEAIALKANSSEVYTKTQTDGLISTEVTNRNAAITAKANEITSSVSETYATKSTVNGIESRVTTAESTITQHATDIEAKVSKDGVIAAINVSVEQSGGSAAKISADKVNIEGATIFTSGRLSQTSLSNAYDAKGAASTAETNAKSYADTKKTEAINSANSTTDTKLASYSTTQQMNSAISTAVDNIDVGGRNLLRGSAAFGTVNSVHGWVSNGTANTISSDVIGGVECFKVTRADANGQIASARTASRVNLEWGKTYIASCWMMFSEDISNTFADTTPLHFHVGSVANTNVFDLSIINHGGGVSTYEIEPPSDYGDTIPANTWVRFVRKIVTANAAPSEEYPYPVFAPFVYGVIRKSTSATERTTWFRGFKFEEGNKPTDWTPAPEDIKADAIAQEQYIYISKGVGTTSVSKNETWVSDVSGNQNTWTAKRPQYSSDYPVLFVARQSQTVAQKAAGTTCSCTTPHIDDTTTIIDGGNIITGSVMANALNAANINASGAINIGAFDVDTSSMVMTSADNSAQALLDAENAAKTATNFITESGENDMLLTAGPQAYRVRLTSSGMEILNPDGDVVGFHGATIQLGSTDGIYFEASETRLAFRTLTQEIAYFGLNDDGIWQMHIATTYVDDMIRFGDYAWIKRDNGNMSIKWLGD